MTRAALLPTALAVAALVLGGCSDDEPLEAAPTETPSASESIEPSQTASSTASPEPSVTSTPTPAPTPTPTETETTAPEPPPAVGPTSYDEAVALLGGASGTTELSRFFSPTTNLYCVLDSPFSPPACELARGAIPDPTACPADGPSQSVGRIELTGGVPQPVCNTDTIREPDAPTLGYGGVATWPDTSVTCLMERVGVTCIDPVAGTGYFLARGLYRTF